jgi:hypothetical protein
LGLPSAAAVTATEALSFSFAPLAGASFGAAVVEPIKPSVFFGMLAQGVHANLLLRTLVQSVTFVWPDIGPNGKPKPKPEHREVLVNMPDEDRFVQFRSFLRLAGLMREMQKPVRSSQTSRQGTSL